MVATSDLIAEFEALPTLVLSLFSSSLILSFCITSYKNNACFLLFVIAEINANFVDMGDIKKELLVRSKAIKMARLSNDLSQSQLAGLTGICEKTISRIERGLVFWRIDTELILINAIAEYSNKLSA